MEQSVGGDSRAGAGFGDRPRVAVCVITYRRPAELSRLLDSLTDLRFPSRPPWLELIVVDNDAEGSAEPIVDDARPRHPWPVHYEVEPRRGIPVARNRALEVASSRVDFVAMVDDDEIATPRWLGELLTTAIEYQAAAVAGPVRPEYREDVPRWVRRAGFFEPARRETGSALPYAWTGNVLLRTSALERLECWFDEDWTSTGGSDVEFFLRLNAAGGQIVWAERAEAYERVAGERASLRWLLRRHYRNGINLARLGRRLRIAERAAHDGRRNYVRWMNKLGEALRAVVQAPRTWWSQSARVLTLFSLAFGYAAGHLGAVVRPYEGPIEDRAPSEASSLKTASN